MPLSDELGKNRLHNTTTNSDAFSQSLQRKGSFLPDLVVFVINESRQQQFYSLAHSYACTVQHCECDGVWWSCLIFRSLSWWLSVGQSAAGCASQPQCEECMLQRAHVLTVANGCCGNECVHVCVHESLPCLLSVHAGCMLPEKCRLRFTKGIAIATASRLQMAAGTRSVWVFCGMRNSGVRNCSLLLPVLVNDELLQRSAHLGQFYLLCYVMPRVVIHHSVLLSDSRPEDLG